MNDALDPAKRVLVVDDNADVCESLSAALQLLGYSVEIATDGLAALEVAVRFRPRLILIDLLLPLVDGWSLARRLASMPMFNQPRLIAISGMTSPVHRAASLAAGFERHLSKPITLATLREVLDPGAEAVRVPVL